MAKIPTHYWLTTISLQREPQFLFESLAKAKASKHSYLALIKSICILCVREMWNEEGGGCHERLFDLSLKCPEMPQI